MTSEWGLRCPLLHAHFATIADDDVDEVEIPLADALMSAFAMFSLKAPSLLAFDKQRAEGNLKTIYGIERAPCDTRMRERVFLLQDDSLCVVPAKGAPQRIDHVLSPDAGRRNHPSGLSCSDSAHA